MLQWKTGRDIGVRADRASGNGVTRRRRRGAQREGGAEAPPSLPVRLRRVAQIGRGAAPLRRVAKAAPAIARASAPVIAASAGLGALTSKKPLESSLVAGAG